LSKQFDPYFVRNSHGKGGKTQSAFFAVLAALRIAVKQ
jgi:hypothetical protein